MYQFYLVVSSGSFNHCFTLLYNKKLTKNNTETQLSTYTISEGTNLIENQ